MNIKIHWGEFCGAAERTEIHLPMDANQKETGDSVYQYCMALRGYLPFKLYKNYITKQWMANTVVDPSISTLVIFYAEKLIDEFEQKNSL